MDRDCNQCVYSTREGGCRKWTCEGTKTVEDIKAETIEQCIESINSWIERQKCFKDTLKYISTNLCEELEQLKEQE